MNILKNEDIQNKIKITNMLSEWEEKKLKFFEHVKEIVQYKLPNKAMEI
jgi:hypothetical protein